ncbi:hypothetical protein LUZ60_002796 [Juncus effusus]|nr:hypothetical protein LUZ60_002796 [Juncus effusus]
MGTFIGHFIPGLFFTFLGFWHTINTIKCYKLKGPSHFISTTWFPLPSKNPYLKHLELYLLLSFSLIVIILQLLNHPFNPLNYEHATMYLHVAIYALVALVTDVSPSCNSNSGFVTALVSSVFAQELFLLHFHSADHVGLEGHYHWLLQVIVTVSVLSTFLSGISSNSFSASMVRSGCLILQGWWFMVMGFSLWVPSMLPRGCHVAEGEVGCESEELKRAVAMANLEFSWGVAGVWILMAFLYVRLDWKMEYRQLNGAGGIGNDQDGLKQSNGVLGNGPAIV